MIYLYATKRDLAEIARDVCTSQPLKFVEAYCDEPEFDIYDDLEHLKPRTGYFAGMVGVEFVVRTINLRKGGTRYEIDPMLNPQTVYIRFGGMWRDHRKWRSQEDRLLNTQIDALDSEESREIFKHFHRVVRARCEKIKSTLVGAEAAKLLDEGVRLPIGSGSPPEYDFKRA